MTQRAFSFSPAVAAQRSEPADSLDFFPTPPWATRAFVQHVARPILGARLGGCHAQGAVTNRSTSSSLIGVRARPNASCNRATSDCAKSVFQTSPA